MSQYTAVAFKNRELERKKEKKRNGKRRRLAARIFFIN